MHEFEELIEWVKEELASEKGEKRKLRLAQPCLARAKRRRAF